MKNILKSLLFSTICAAGIVGIAVFFVGLINLNAGIGFSVLFIIMIIVFAICFYLGFKYK